jgi:UDP-glucose 4-epimerase
VYVDDVVEALARAATVPAPMCQVINVGSGVETSINALIDIIADVTDTKPHRLYVSEQRQGVSRLCADLTRARQTLDYTPRVFLHEGLRRILSEDARFVAPPTE